MHTYNWITLLYSWNEHILIIYLQNKKLKEFLKNWQLKIRQRVYNGQTQISAPEISREHCTLFKSSWHKVNSMDTEFRHLWV